MKFAHIFFLVSAFVSGCGSFPSAQTLTVFSRIDFEFVTESNNAVFGLQRRPFLVAGRTDIPDEFKNPLPRCTGFFVSEKHFLTAYHCLPNLQTIRFNHVSLQSGWLTHVIPDATGRLSFLGSVRDPVLYPVSGDDLLWSDPDLDVALVHWSSSDAHGVLPVCTEAVLGSQGATEVELLGYPQGLPLTRSGGRAWPLDLAISNVLFSHDADSLSGQSGGPILVKSGTRQGCVAGVHVRGAGRNVFTAPLSESEQSSAVDYAKTACLKEPDTSRPSCEASYAYNKAVRMEVVLEKLKLSSEELWSQVTMRAGESTNEEQSSHSKDM